MHQRESLRESTVDRSENCLPYVGSARIDNGVLVTSQYFSVLRSASRIRSRCLTIQGDHSRGFNPKQCPATAAMGPL